MISDRTRSAAGGRDWIHLLIGPALFAAALIWPVSSPPLPVRFSLGLAAWMSWWWISRPLALAVTGLLPLVVAPAAGFVDLGSVLHAYSQPLLLLLLGANLLTSLWTRAGLDKRIAAWALLMVGSGARRQILSWFLLSAALSAILPNTIVAAMLIPLAVVMLEFVGIHDLWESRFGSAAVIAIAWGTSVGGFATPLGGAPNLLAVEAVEKLSGREFSFGAWVSRMWCLELLLVLFATLYVGSVFRPEIDRLPSSRRFCRQRLQEMGTMSGAQIWGLVLFASAAALAFARPLYADRFPSLTPAFAFLGCGMLCFVIRSAGEPLLRWEFAERHMMWGLFCLFAGGSALGGILSQTGGARYLAQLLAPLAKGGGPTAVLAFALLTALVTQVTSNTAAVAVVIPITVSTFQNLGLNPLPFVYVVTAVGNCGFLLPSSAGGTAVAAGYGVNLKTMLWKGVGLFAGSVFLLAMGGYLLFRYWPPFSTV